MAEKISAIDTQEGVDLLTFAAEKNMTQAKKKLFDIEIKTVSVLPENILSILKK